jgi:hypothetical protein
MVSRADFTGAEGTIRVPVRTNVFIILAAWQRACVRETPCKHGRNPGFHLLRRAAWHHLLPIPPIQIGNDQDRKL